MGWQRKRDGKMPKALKVGITGLPQAGKTDILHRVIDMLEGEGIKVGGMITEAILDGGKRVGFNVMDWETKEKEVMAHKDIETETSRMRVEDFGVNVEAIDRIGVPAIMKAIEDADVIVIDEIGRMEVLSHEFIKAVKETFDMDKPLIITLHKKSRNPLLQDIRRRDDVRILEVTPINRSILPYKIVRLVKEELENIDMLEK